MTDPDRRLFADPPVRDARFEVRQLWSEMENIWDDDGKMLVEFLHRQMNEEVNGLEIAARNLTDFPEADWDLRLAIARQCWDEARHVEAFRRLYERRGGAVGAYPVLNFEYRMATALPTLIGRLAVQNRSFEAAGIQAIQDALKRTTEEDLRELLEAQLADEVQHVRYANRWVTDLIRREPRRALDVVRAVSQANEAFRTVAGEAFVEIVLDEEMKRETGLLGPETAQGAAR
jgi:uncharacterized ferritin-like protein (DUF455 family)